MSSSFDITPGYLLQKVELVDGPARGLRQEKVGAAIRTIAKALKVNTAQPFKDSDVARLEQLLDGHGGIRLLQPAAIFVDLLLNIDQPHWKVALGGLAQRTNCVVSLRGVRPVGADFLDFVKLRHFESADRDERLEFALGNLERLSWRSPLAVNLQSPQRSLIISMFQSLEGDALTAAIRQGRKYLIDLADFTTVHRKSFLTVPLPSENVKGSVEAGVSERLTIADLFRLDFPGQNERKSSRTLQAERCLLDIFGVFDEALFDTIAVDRVRFDVLAQEFAGRRQEVGLRALLAIAHYLHPERIDLPSSEDLNLFPGRLLSRRLRKFILTALRSNRQRWPISFFSLTTTKRRQRYKKIN